MLDYPSSLAVTPNYFSGSGPSPAIWSKMVGRQMSGGSGRGFIVGDDFGLVSGFSAATGVVTVPTAGATTVSGLGDYVCYADTAGVISRVSMAGGVIRLSTDVDGTNDDNDIVAINSGVLGEISRTAGEEALTCFECRFRLPSQVTSGTVAIGLAAPAVAADGGHIVDTGEIITTGGDFLGIRTLDADPDGFDFGYKVGGTAGLTVTKADAKVIAADTWVKFGMTYDPTAEATKRIAYYLDGVKQATHITDASMALATFPNSVQLGFHASVKADGLTVARALDVDYWYFGQYIA